MGKNDLENLGVEDRMILKMEIARKVRGGVRWIDLAQDRDRWLALANALMNLLVQ